MRSNTEKKYWAFKMGAGGHYLPIARTRNFIGIHWTEIPNLSDWAVLDYHESGLWERFKGFYAEHDPGKTPVQLGINAGQVWAFAIEMMPGDLVVAPDTPGGVVEIGELCEQYYYDASPQDLCPYQHRRNVKWLKTVPKLDLSERLRTAMGGQLTVYRLAEYGDEIEILAGRKTRVEQKGSPVIGEALTTAIIHRLRDLSPEDFERFVGQVLTSAGFTTVVTQLVGDGGVDVIGTLNADNLAEINLHVQVKRRTASVGIREILQLRGTLGPDEHAAFVTLGSFTKQAIEEAQYPGKREIKLIGGDSLVGLILNGYDRLDDKHRHFLGIERRAIPLVDQFTMRKTEG